MWRYPIGTKLNNSQHKGAESATPVTLDIRISLWLTDKRAAVALTPPSIVLSFPDVRLTLSCQIASVIETLAFTVFN
jgi:hypothetical protein